MEWRECSGYKQHSTTLLGDKSDDGSIKSGKALGEIKKALGSLPGNLSANQLWSAGPHKDATNLLIDQRNTRYGVLALLPLLLKWHLG
jgi:hypothetical protein